MTEKPCSPLSVRLDALSEAFTGLFEAKNPLVIFSLLPSAWRGIALQRGKQGLPTEVPASHKAWLEWSYPNDAKEMGALYELALSAQWKASELPWEIEVDPSNPETPLLAEDFFAWDKLETHGIRLDASERARFRHSVAGWMLSQFLHGEQGALIASAQVTESVPLFAGKLYGSTQVLDEARHIEAFHRYLWTKLECLYPINNNLFVILDAILRDERWDMKFLGMQLMVEGVALGAFATIERETGEPLLRTLLRYVIQDEARHVHYGVLALERFIRDGLNEAERREREDWAFEVALLMRNRFLAEEVYEEWFEGLLSRAAWRTIVLESPGMARFRHELFSRLLPRLKSIGLLSNRIRPHYEALGLGAYIDQSPEGVTTRA
ncbi:MAG: ferritin-like domain-containing protein [Sandaracinaceae bacterium]|nr:ferritin-like domain-containing protein [Sandaracinaceae bacterium]